MRIVFMGTPDFSVPCLQRLIADGEEVVGVFTQPDKPKGRGYELTPPPVKVEALKHNIPVFQPKSMRDGEALKILETLQPDLNVVVAYGKILPPEILYFPKYNSINIHASILPKYRGAAPIQWVILNGEEKTGVTSMQMDDGIDTGDMLLKAELPIPPNMTGGELHDALSSLGAQVLSDTLKALKNGDLHPTKQTGESNYAPMLNKALCPIDFSRTAQDVHNHVRGLSPFPTATAVLHGKRMKIHTTRLTENTSTAPAGTIVSATDGIEVVCGDGKTVLVTELQPEGKKRMTAKAFLVGHKLQAGESFE